MTPLPTPFRATGSDLSVRPPNPGRAGRKLSETPSRALANPSPAPAEKAGTLSHCPEASVTNGQPTLWGLRVLSGGSRLLASEPNTTSEKVDVTGWRDSQPLSRFGATKSRRRGETRALLGSPGGVERTGPAPVAYALIEVGQVERYHSGASTPPAIQSRRASSLGKPRPVCDFLAGRGALAQRGARHV